MYCIPNMVIPSPDVIPSQRDETFSIQLRVVTLQSLNTCKAAAIPGGIPAQTGNVSCKVSLEL